MKLKNSKIAVISTLLLSSLSMISCDGVDDQSSILAPDSGEEIAEAEDTLGLGAIVELEVGDVVSLEFPEDNTSISIRVLSPGRVDYVPNFDGNDIQAGPIAFFSLPLDDIFSLSLRPTVLPNAGVVTNINELIATNSELSTLLENAFNLPADPDNPLPVTDILSRAEINQIITIVTESLTNITISFDEEFFIVRDAELFSVGSRGTFTRSGSVLMFNSNSVSVGDELVNSLGNPNVIFE